MKLKKLLFSVMSVALAMSVLSVPTYANDNTQQVIEKRGVGEIPKELIWDKSELSKYTPSDYSVYTYLVTKGTLSEQQIGYIDVHDDNGYTLGLIPLTGNMLDDFDSSTTGQKTFILSNDVWKTEITVDITETSNMNNVGKPSSIQANVFGIRENLMDIGEDFTMGTINVLDDLGNTIYNVELKKEDIPNFDNTQTGKKSFPISYIGLNTNLEIEFREFHRVTFVGPIAQSDTFIIPIGTDLKKFGAIHTVYAIDENGNEFPMGRGSGDFPSELIAKVDISKAGVYNVEATQQSTGELFKAKIIVGLPTQSTVDELLPKEAQESMPSNELLGVWNIPSGDAGAGTWVFQTGMIKGSKVDVWSYHNNAWLSIGTYSVDENGNVSVSFTANQLSPVIIVKNTETPKEDITTPTNPNNNGQKTDNNKPTDIPNTGVNNNVALLSLITLASACVLVLLMKKRKLVK